MSTQLARQNLGEGGPEAGKALYLDPSQALDKRVDDLIRRLTLEEKVSQLVHEAAAVERLGIPAYNWWNEALHGVARAGRATVFPQAIGLAATFNTDLIHRVASTIGDEGRAKHHAAVRHGSPLAYTGLTFWSPNINIFRDPRWGRGHETYGEDPYLTARLGVAFIQGLQGDHPKYLKTAACAKHYAVHSGPEKLRFEFNAEVSPKDLRETYLPAFKAAVQEAKVEAVMGAYNRTNGELCCASPTLLKQILLDEWGFDGHVLSDCGAIQKFYETHKVTKTPEESAALAVNNGCNLNCGCTYQFLGQAVEQGLVNETAIDAALHKVMRTRFRLGMFDPPDMVPFTKTPEDVVDCAEHRELARQAARESIVLLKNNGLLPLGKKFKSIIVVGPNASSLEVLLGNYYGLNPQMVTALEGILGQAGPEIQVNYVSGCPLSGDSKAAFDAAAYWAADHELVIAVMGLAPRLEGEMGDAEDSDGGDRVDIGMPGVQEEFLKRLHESGKPIVLVLSGGSAVAVNWAQEHVDAIVCMWYAGEEGGNALGDVLFGGHNPGGRLPVTFYKAAADLPPFEDYAMHGRTYRYFEGEPLYPFGFGLSYTRFQYSDLRLNAASIAAGEELQVQVSVRNVGDSAGNEVVQLYLTALDAPVPTPRCQLSGFSRIQLEPGESRTVNFTVTPEMLELVDNEGKTKVEPGRFRVTVGGCSPGPRGVALGAPEPVIAEVELN